MNDALHEELVALIGRERVLTDEATRAQASRDGSHLSPILSAKRDSWPPADVVVYPQNVDELAEVVAASVRHRVPITPRGRGTANYGQTIPMRRGLVIDTRKLSRIVGVSPGLIRAEAGTTMLALERAAIATGQELLLYPSTVNSSLGGFLAGGSGGTGSVANGMIAEGFVESLTIIPAAPEPTILTVDGARTRDFLHRYGTVGIIAEAVVRLEPLQEWLAFYAAFPTQVEAVSAMRELCAAPPLPRLISVDPPLLAATLPQTDDLVRPGAASMRVILDARMRDTATEIVTRHGGEVTAVREGLSETMRMSTTSYNHAIEWLQKSQPGVYFHLETFGAALLDRLDEVSAVYPDTVVHLEGLGNGSAIGLLAGRYESEQAVYDGFSRLADLGVGLHNPHQWYVDIEPEATRVLAAEIDPEGLLNPGKLAEPDVVTRMP